MIPHHVVTGPEDAPPLVLSNSLGATLAMWDPQADALAEHFRLIRYDTRGHGGSDIPPGPYSIDDVGSDVVELLDHLGIERAHFAGLSLGGMTGMWLGANAPERDRPARAALHLREARPAARCGPTAPTPCASRAPARSSTRRWSAGSPRATATRFDLSARARDVREHRRRGLRELLRGDRAHGPDRRRCANIAAPTLVIAGAQDPATPPEHAERIVAAIPDARLEVLDPGAHLVNVERPDAVTELILDHLEG